MRRREFIRVLGGGGALWWPATASAQTGTPRSPPRLLLVAVVEPVSAFKALRQALAGLGYVDGQSVVHH
jgi:hypothetical protein